MQGVHDAHSGKVIISINTGKIYCALFYICY